MRLVEKRGQKPRVTLEKAEVSRMLEASYLLKRVGVLLDKGEAVDVSIAIRSLVFELAPDWIADPETGELTKRPKEAEPEATSEPEKAPEPVKRGNPKTMPEVRDAAF